MKRLTLGIALAALLVPALPLEAGGSRSSGTAVRVAHRRPYVYWRRPWYWGWGYGWYDPFWYGPYGYGPGYGYGYGYGRYAPLRNWAVVDTDVSPESARVYLDGEFLGTAGPTVQIVEGIDEVEIGWHTRPGRKGEGIAPEAAAAARDWAFANLDIDHVISLVRPENLASRRVAEKLGMRVDREVDHKGLRHRVYRFDRVTSD